MGCSCSKTVEKDTQKLKQNKYSLEVISTFQETSPILSMAALDESTIVYGQKGVIKIYNSNTKETKEFTKEHAKRVDGIKFLSNKQLLTFGQDKLIKIWDINKSESLMTLQGHTSLIWDVIELQDGRLISADDDKKLIVWDLQKKSMDFILSEGKESFGALIQHSNGSIITAGGSSKKIAFWDLASKSMIDSIELDQELWSLTYITENRIAIGCGNGDIKIFNPIEKMTVFTLKGDIPVCIHSILLLDDGFILSTSECNSIYIWNLNQPGVKIALEGHTLPVTSVCKISNRLIVSAGKDNTLKIWG